MFRENRAEVYCNVSSELRASCSEEYPLPIPQTFIPSMSGPNVSCERKHEQILKKSRLLVIGLKHSRHFFNQSEMKPKPIAIRSRFPALFVSFMYVRQSSFDWLTIIHCLCTS